MPPFLGITMENFFRRYVFGDTAVYYIQSPAEGREGTTIGLCAVPADRAVTDPFKLNPESLVQVAFTGDETLTAYTRGVTMRNRSSVFLHVVGQEKRQDGVATSLSDGKGNGYEHILSYDEKTGVFSSEVVYHNGTGAARTLEFLASLSLSGISSPETGCGLKLYRMTSAWSRECRLKCDTFSALGLEASWAGYGVKCEKWGQVGSMANRGWYPFAAIGEEGRALAFTQEAPASWQMEVCLEKETCSFTAGQGDYEFAHWRKTVPAGGTFSTRRAYFTVKQDLLSACNALVRFQDSRLCVPESEEEMPVLFNEYCTTWGDPSEEKIDKILPALRRLGIGTFVIDCGWYKPENGEWGNAVGDWRESKALFPHGIRSTVNRINAAGMRAGIWFEYEIAGRDSELFRREDLLLKRDGAVITARDRRFLDLRLPAGKAYLREKLVRFLKENGFSYLKTDYNESFGVGCDSPHGEAPGEGGRQVCEESVAWVDELRREIPDLVIENCASGGSRVEPLRMSKVSMCSFSDAHECDEIPFVAANVSRVVPARQMQVWAVLREGDSPARTVYSLAAAMLGRICLSGDVVNMTEEKRTLLRAGLDFYGEVKEIVKRGNIVGIDCNVQSYRAPRGRQIYTKEYEERRLVIVHALGDSQEIVVPLNGYRLKRAFTVCGYSVCDGALCLWAAKEGGGASEEEGNFRAGAFLLEKVSADY